jgi:hypothetical protein
MVTVKKPPFSRSEWTQVAFTFTDVNSSAGKPARASFYLNGRPQGQLEQPMQMKWDLKQTAIMIGIFYVGDIDDLLVFRRALEPQEIRFLYESKATF